MGPDQLAEAGMTEEDGKAVLLECLEYLTRLWKERAARPPTGEHDFVSAMAHSEAMRDIAPDVAPLDYGDADPS